MSGSAPLIKGYLPVRLKLPGREDETFMFVKKHQHDGNRSQKLGSEGGENKISMASTIFVNNVPFIPHVNTRIFLQSFFSHYGVVQSVVAVRNPRSIKSIETTLGEFDYEKNKGGEGNQADAIEKWKELVEKTSNIFPIYESYDEGKFAHVAFTSQKDMERALKQLRKKSAEGSIELSKTFFEDLVQQAKVIERRGDGGDEDSGDETSKAAKKKILFTQIAGKYRNRRIPRNELLDYCNQVMQQFEKKEQESEEAAKRARSEPDEDGFITVTYKNTAQNQVGSKRELEMTEVSEQDECGRKRHKRSRKKQKSSGARELPDFYRFQHRETRKKGLQDLRKRFEEDLATVKKIKEEKKYRPF